MALPQLPRGLLVPMRKHLILRSQSVATMPLETCAIRENASRRYAQR